MLSRTIVIDDITPEEMAAIFADMFGQDQARFFNALRPITDKWPGAGWCQQSSVIVPHLDRGGTEVILKLAEWAADPTGENA